MSKHSFSLSSSDLSLIFSLYTLISVWVFQICSLWESDIFTRVLQNNEIEHGNERAPPSCQASLWIPESFRFSDWDLEVPWMWSNGDQYTHRHILPFKRSLLKMSLSLKMWINIVKAHQMCVPWKCHLIILYATYICFSLFSFLSFYDSLSQSCWPTEGS